MELAGTARTAEHKRLLTDLAQSWLNFALEIERANAILSEHGPAADAPGAGPPARDAPRQDAANGGA
jgi:hypothetical protein